MALALIDTAPAHNERSGCTACKARHALQSVFIKDGLRPIDSVSSLDSVRIGSAPCFNRKTWDSSDSRSLYAVDGWGRPYFSVEDSGHLCVKTTGISHLLPATAQSLSLWCYNICSRSNTSDDGIDRLASRVGLSFAHRRLGVFDWVIARQRCPDAGIPQIRC